MTYMVMTAVPFESSHCSNNAVPFDASDGLNICAVFSFLTVYFDYATTMAWLVQAIDLYLKVCWGMSKASYFKLHLLLIFGFPCLPCIFLGAYQLYGYQGTNFPCLIARKFAVEKNGDIFLLYFPLSGLVLIGVVCMSQVIIQIIRSNRQVHQHHQVVPYPSTGSGTGKAELNNDNNNDENIELVSTHANQSTGGFVLGMIPRMFYRSVPVENVDSAVSSPTTSVKTRQQQSNSTSFAMLRTPLIFMFAYLFIYAILFIYRGILYTETIPLTKSLTDWTVCAFKNFRGDGSWKLICGNYPGHRPSIRIAVAFYGMQGGQGLLLTFIYLSNPNVWKTFRKNLISLNSKLVKRLFNSKGSSSKRERVGVEDAEGAIASIMPRPVAMDPSLMESNMAVMNTTIYHQNESPHPRQYSTLMPLNEGEVLPDELSPNALSSLIPNSQSTKEVHPMSSFVLADESSKTTDAPLAPLLEAASD